MTKQKLTLSFVNKGKPFEVPNWTPEKHEASLAKLAKAQKENKAINIIKELIEKEEIILMSGDNLVVMPKQPKETAIEIVLEDVMENIERVDYYNEETKSIVKRYNKNDLCLFGYEFEQE